MPERRPVRRKVPPPPPPPLEGEEFVTIEKIGIPAWAYGIIIVGVVLFLGMITFLVFSSNGDPVVAITNFESGDHQMETPEFEVKDDWYIAFDSTGYVRYLFVLNLETEDVTRYPLMQKHGRIHTRRGGRYKVKLLGYRNDTRVAVFQNAPASIRSIPSSRWVDQ